MTNDLNPVSAVREAERVRRRSAFAHAAADHAADAGERFRAALIRAKARRLDHEARRLELSMRMRAFGSRAWA